MNAGFAAAAVIFAVFGGFMLLAEVQSPSFVMWVGTEAHGYTQGGTTHYVYRGVEYDIPNRWASPYDTRRTPTTVWLPRGHATDSTRAYIDSPATRWLDFSLVVGWFVVAFGLVVAGMLRNRTPRHAPRGGTFFAKRAWPGS